MGGLLSCCGASRALLGGNAPEDDGSGALDDFQALWQELGVSMPKLDIVGVGLNRYAVGTRTTFSS